MSIEGSRHLNMNIKTGGGELKGNFGKAGQAAASLFNSAWENRESIREE